nr:MAG TPA: hypothetical protein [Caudoviricetes sp.]
MLSCFFAEVNIKNAKKQKNYCLFNDYMLLLIRKEKET